MPSQHLQSHMHLQPQQSAMQQDQAQQQPQPQAQYAPSQYAPTQSQYPPTQYAPTEYAPTQNAPAKRVTFDDAAPQVYADDEGDDVERFQNPETHDRDFMDGAFVLTACVFLIIVGVCLLPRTLTKSSVVQGVPYGSVILRASVGTAAFFFLYWALATLRTWMRRDPS